MSYLPSEVVSVITKFLPNDDITDLMFLSRNFNALVTPRLREIDQEMATMNQSIESFMPMPAPDETDSNWITQLNLQRFEPVGSEAKKRMKEVFKEDSRENAFLKCVRNAKDRNVSLHRFKQILSLERFDDPTFLRVLCVLLSRPKFCEEYNVMCSMAGYIHLICKHRLEHRYGQTFRDVELIWAFYHSYYPISIISQLFQQYN
ncbi:hypothetical protein Ddc_16547 [Ditylenchus destructor]|nr:hypothetical protein Ddc_16547 [Ditylenchus destructor]